jgi:MoxR-like ATPase
VEFVTPEHVRTLAIPVLAHRLALDPQSRFSGVTTADVVSNVIRGIPAPA